MKTLLKNRELSAFFAIVALFVVLVALNPAYFSLQTLAMIFSSSQILCLLALGATLVMLTRNIDVSVGSTVGLCAIAVGVALNNGYGLATAIAFALAIGALAGAFNGLLVVGLLSGDRRDARYAGVVSRGDVAVDRREMDRRLARQPEIALGARVYRRVAAGLAGAGAAAGGRLAAVAHRLWS